MAWVNFPGSDSYACEDAYVASAGLPAEIGQAQSLAERMHYGGFVVSRGTAYFRDRAPADVQAGRFQSRSSVTLFVAPQPQPLHAGAGALLQSQFLDHKQQLEWVALPLSVTATAPARRLCIAALWRVKGQPIRGKIQAVLRRSGEILATIQAERSNVALCSNEEKDVSLDAGDVVDFRVHTGNHVPGRPLVDQRERWRRYTVMVRELKCVLWPAPPPRRGAGKRLAAGQSGPGRE